MLPSSLTFRIHAPQIIRLHICTCIYLAVFIICMYVYICIYTHDTTHHIYIYIYIYEYISVCMYVCVCVYIYIYIYTASDSCPMTYELFSVSRTCCLQALSLFVAELAVSFVDECRAGKFCLSYQFADSLFLFPCQCMTS